MDGCDFDCCALVVFGDQNAEAFNLLLISGDEDMVFSNWFVVSMPKRPSKARVVRSALAIVSSWSTLNRRDGMSFTSYD